MTKHALQHMLSVAVVAIFCLSCGGKVPAELAPDKILTNGKIVTVDADFSIAEAAAIRDGKFVAVGKTGDIQALAGAKTEVIDLEGKTVLPGFTDGHGHVTLTWGKAHDPIEAKFRNAQSIDEILDLLREKAKVIGPDELLWFDRGPSSPERLKENRWPNRYDLDKVSRDRPILLSLGPAGSNLVVNSKLLQTAGVTRNTPQPTRFGVQGEVVMDPETGEPTGVFLGWAAEAIVRGKIQLYPMEVQAENIKRAAEEMVKYGITTVGDPNTAVAGTDDNIPFIRAYEKLAANNELLVRVNCIPRVPLLTVPVSECINYINRLPYYPGFGNDYLLLRMVKIVVNDSRGPFKLSHDDVKAVVKAVHRAGWQMMVHVGGGESFDVALDAIDEAYKEHPDGPKRHVITHARTPTDKNLEIMKRWGIMADPQPGSMYNLPDNAEESVSTPDRPAYGPLPLRTYLDRGVAVMVSSDQQPVGPMFHVFEAVNRVRKSGKPIVPQEAVTVQEAIRMATIMPAYATHEEDIKGSIEPGKLADLIVLGKDILTVPAAEIKDIPILQTMIGGKFVYTNPDKDPNQEVKYWDPGQSRFIRMDVPEKQ
ncbi:MAG: amidohydrolase [Acidobacteria bacterium]|nr:amidohydrolase [Acidobacteriota bacterium]